jgi:hypothetical protein
MLYLIKRRKEMTVREKQQRSRKSCQVVMLHLQSKHVWPRLHINVGTSSNLLLLYGLKPGHSALRKEHNVKLFENRMLREYLPHENGRECCRKLRHTELYDSRD